MAYLFIAYLIVFCDCLILCCPMCPFLLHPWITFSPVFFPKFNMLHLKMGVGPWKRKNFASGNGDSLPFVFRLAAVIYGGELRS